jgi:hypothetical protein
MAPSLEVGCDGVVLHAAMASRLDLPPLWAAARGDKTLLLRFHFRSFSNAETCCFFRLALLLAWPLNEFCLLLISD